MSRAIKFWWQRVTRGWDDSETWAIDVTVSKFVLPRLKRYKDVNIVCWEAANKEEGCDIIDELIWWHGVVAGDCGESDSDACRCERAARLWGQYYNGLWW